MNTYSLLFAGIAASIHFLFFVMESIFWTNPKVYKGFGIKTIEDANLLKVFLLNQGFYNLFLTIGVAVGFYFLKTGNTDIGKTLILFSCASMLAASLVLFASKPSMLSGVFIQGLCPLLAILCYVFCK